MSGQPGAAEGRGVRSIANWKWWTFPVYFALSVGLFAGYNIGVLAGPKTHIGYAANIVSAIMFSFGLAQLATRPLTEFMLRRRAQQERRKNSGHS